MTGDEDCLQLAGLPLPVVPLLAEDAPATRARMARAETTRRPGRWSMPFSFRSNEPDQDEAGLLRSPVVRSTERRWCVAVPGIGLRWFGQPARWQVFPGDAGMST